MADLTISPTDDVSAHTALLRDQEDGNHDEAEVDAQSHAPISSPGQAITNDDISGSLGIQPDPMAEEAEIHRPTSRGPDPSADGSILGVSRDTVEEMMRAWTRVLIQSLRKESERPAGDQNPENVELGNMRREENASHDQAQSPKPNEMDANAEDDCWLGQPVEVWSEQQIQEENEQRLEIPLYRREPIPTVSQGYYVPNDLWAPYWDATQAPRPSRESSRPQWRGTTGMLELQNRLALALRSKWDPTWPRSSWCRIKLLGIRLRNSKIRGQMADKKMLTSNQNECTEQIYIKILLEFLWEQSSRRRRDIVTLNSMLETCYRKGILKQKTTNGSQQVTFESFSKIQILTYHAAVIVQAVTKLHTGFHVQWPSRGIQGILYDSFIHQTTATVKRFIGLDDDTMPLNTEDLAVRLCVSPIKGRSDTGDFACHSELDSQADATHFRQESLRISMLQSVGSLKIHWAANISDHLQVLHQDGSVVLYLWWYNENSSFPYADPPGLFDAQKTFCVLFGYDEGEKQKFLKAYDKIGLPPWYCCESTEPHPALKRRQSPACGDVQAHLDTQQPWNKLPSQVPFSEFGVFEKRLRALDWYMQQQRPKGLHGLWKDKRDSYSFYTLWLVIIFGGISILLAFASLVVSALQAWAAFHTPGT